MEEQLIRKIKGGMLGMKNGTKTASEVGPLLNRLKVVNEGIYSDLFGEYQKILTEKNV